MPRIDRLSKWLTPGIRIKRWLALLVVSSILVATGLAFLFLLSLNFQVTGLSIWFEILACLVLIILGCGGIAYSSLKITRRLLEPYRGGQQGKVIDSLYAHSRRQKGIRVVAVGGGTGLPSVLRGLKPHTSNITAVVTVADDGGSSGRLRKELGVLPPGDLRNNIAALADDESLMTQLFQYRFGAGDLSGHAFGNLFISALAGVTGSIETALIETGRVLNIQGRVLPATLDDVNLAALIRLPNQAEPIVVHGESSITEANGKIEEIMLEPSTVRAFGDSVQAILDADVVVIGPGSLFTSIIPNLLVNGIQEALRATSAYCIYVCNVATQPGETDDFTVADHVIALEQHIGRGLFQVVMANDIYPTENAGANTLYVKPAPPGHDIHQRYHIHYTDLTDSERPWRHDPKKLGRAILKIRNEERSGTHQAVDEPTIPL
jgi:uncharacterized cofD-like protein